MAKQNFKEQVKEWWNDNKRVIKTGAICLGLGCLYGFVKGVNTMTGLITRQESTTVNNFKYDEANVDDPEMLELIRLEEESLTKEKEG